LALRPGETVVRDLGGLHRFMQWDGPILTDSGGFQLFSLAQMTRVSEEGAVFRSHLDGSTVSLTPERAVEIQEVLGSDVAIVLDFTVPALPADKPRYLMGVGRPQDLLEAVARGIDLFDCVMPTRNGRNAIAFTDAGPLRFRNQRFERDSRPLEADCPCIACRH